MEISKHSFIKVTASEGMVLTNYKEGDDILDYYSTTMVVVADEAAAALWREITEAQNKEYIEMMKQSSSGSTSM